MLPTGSSLVNTSQGTKGRGLILPAKGAGGRLEEAAHCGYYLNNRVNLSKALSCDRLPEENCCSQQILARERSSSAYMKFEHQNYEGTYDT